VASRGALKAGFYKILLQTTRADFVLDQSAHLFTFSLSANHNAGNEKFTPGRARKYCNNVHQQRILLFHQNFPEHSINIQYS
jgi:hypothetical protein